eukprot:scaffold63005_cov65-Phaeocystis_antarctica.AAC.3
MAMLTRLYRLGARLGYTNLAYDGGRRADRVPAARGGAARERPGREAALGRQPGILRRGGTGAGYAIRAW